MKSRIIRGTDIRLTIGGIEFKNVHSVVYEAKEDIVEEKRFIRIELERGLRALHVIKVRSDGKMERAIVPIPDDIQVTQISQFEYQFDPPMVFEPWMPGLIFKEIQDEPGPKKEVSEEEKLKFIEEIERINALGQTKSDIQSKRIQELEDSKMEKK